MKRYAKVIDEQTKKCEVGIGTNEKFYKARGMSVMDVEQAYDGCCYLVGYCPKEPEKTYEEMRVQEYPALTEQLDSLWHDIDEGHLGAKAKQSKFYLNNKEVKDKYPKTVEV